jgi:hypothetical protein
LRNVVACCVSVSLLLGGLTPARSARAQGTGSGHLEGGGTGSGSGHLEGGGTGSGSGHLEGGGTGSGSGHLEGGGSGSGSGHSEGSGSGSGHVEDSQAPPIPPDIKNQCADAYEATQRERAAGHLQIARKNGIFCAQANCPEVLRSDCAKWTDEVSSSIPSLVIEVRSPNGELLSNVSVEVDGEPFAQHLDGRAVEIDPGRRHFRFEALGLAPVEQDLVLLEGHDTQRLRVTLALLPARPAPARRIPLASYLLGGVGALGIGSFAFFGLTGNNKKNALDSCRPACNLADKKPIQNDYLAADISLGVGTVAVGAALWLAIQGEAAPLDEPALSVRAGSQGALVTYARNF